MQTILVFTVALHLLSGIFWAGSTFVLARVGGAEAEQLSRPQMGAAAVAVLTGGVLWRLLHAHSFQAGEQILALGASCALIAAAVQGTTAMRVRLARANAAQALTFGSIALPQRVAAVLLAITVICMASARYV
jgi:spore coat protein U-like protein